MIIQSAPRLTLRRTDLPGGPSDDWSVILDGKEEIGRIYRMPNMGGDLWFWGLNMFPSSAANSGYAPSLEEAKARFRARWEALS